MRTAFEMVLADVRGNPTSYSSVELASDICNRISGTLSGRAWLYKKEAEKTTGIEREGLKELEAKASRLAYYFHREAALASEGNPNAVIRAVACHTIFERKKLDNKNYILNRPIHYDGHKTRQRQPACINR